VRLHPGEQEAVPSSLEQSFHRTEHWTMPCIPANIRDNIPPSVVSASLSGKMTKADLRIGFPCYNSQNGELRWSSFVDRSAHAARFCVFAAVAVPVSRNRVIPARGAFTRERNCF
jgi:hypothetical protein